MKPISSGVERVIDADLLGGAAAASGLLTDRMSLCRLMLSFTARPRSLAIVDTRSTALMNSAFDTFSCLSLALRDDAPVVGESAVDQLGGEREVPISKRDLGGADANLDAVGATFDQAVQLVHGLAREDDAWHALGALGSGSSTWASR